MFAGRHPETGEQLARRPNGSSKRPVIAGFDLTFKAPKSVSILFAANDELADVMSAAHETAVTKALAAFEDYAMRVRRGHNGTQAERDAGLERGWETAQVAAPGGGAGGAVPASCLAGDGPASAHARADPEHGQGPGRALDRA